MFLHGFQTVNYFIQYCCREQRDVADRHLRCGKSAETAFVDVELQTPAYGTDDRVATYWSTDSEKLETRPGGVLDTARKALLMRQGNSACTALPVVVDACGAGRAEPGALLRERLPYQSIGSLSSGRRTFVWGHSVLMLSGHEV